MGTTEDINALKGQLRDYMTACGAEFDTSKRRPIVRCPSPDHADEHPSAVLYEERIWCPVCDKKWDIFDVAGFQIGSSQFLDQKDEVTKKLGVVSPTKKPSVRKRFKKKRNSRQKMLTDEEAKGLFTKEYLLNMAGNMGWGDTVAGAWKYRNKDGLISIVDVRFEWKDQPGKKAVISFWSDGQRVYAKGCPVELYNLEAIEKDKEAPLLVVEGAKAAEAAKKIPGFIPTTWNGGCKKVKLADWEQLADREIYIYPDDDQHRFDNGRRKPWHSQEGVAAALEIKKLLPGAVIVTPLEEARKIKESGADIVEALEVKEPDDMADYILSAVRIEPPKEKKIDATVLEKNPLPFSILGTSDDGRFFFIGRNDRLVDFPAGSTSKTLLLQLAPLNFWRAHFAIEGKISWDSAIDSVIAITSMKDFDPDVIRGRGAWRNSDHSVCFHDGAYTLNKKDDSKIYLRKTKKDLGLTGDVVDYDVTDKIAYTVRKMSFETNVDCERFLGWTVLAPFCGALPWRPALLLTGESGSGKSTAIDRIVRPIAMPEIFSGGESTEAGIRQRIGVDASAIVIEEAETDTPKKKMRREDIFSLMRQSTSDNAPRVAKGTTSQKSILFSMRSIFLFAAISPEVESVADDNRIFRVNMVTPTREWKPIAKTLDSYITPTNCQKIRALTFRRLDDVMKLANHVVPMIMEKTGKDRRFCLADGLLFAAYRLIWQGKAPVTDRELQTLIEVQYGILPVEETRDETEELLDRLLDEQMQIENSDVYASVKRERLTLREILIDSFIKDDKYLQSIAARFGLKIDELGNLVIAINHHEIMRILQKGRGYHRQLIRHPGLVDKMKVVRLAGKARRCITIKGAIDV
jgi:hypothetical protein